jgi:iron complex transport system substrate-binding protein
MKMKKITKAGAVLLTAITLLAVFAGCGKKELDDTKAQLEASQAELMQLKSDKAEAEAKAAALEAEAADYDGKLIFDRTMELDYAQNFKVDYYKGGYRMMTIYNRAEDVIDGYVPRTSQFLLIPENMSVPENLDSNVIILQVPVTNIMVSSTGAVSQFAAISALDCISLVSTEYDSWYIQEVKDAMDAGNISYVGSYKAPEYETIISTKSTLGIHSTMLTGVPEVAQQLVDTCGMSIMYDQSSYENHPLGRIEWLKLYGAMTGHEAEAEAVYNEQKQIVDSLSAQESSGKTVAIFYITSQGKLFVRNQLDYLVKMANLAGLTYTASSIGVGETGTTNITMEAFYELAAEADYIVYLWSLGGKPETLADFTAKDQILTEFKAVKEGNVWCTSASFFQINDRLGSVIGDLSEMQTTTSDQLDYLFRLK